MAREHRLNRWFLKNPYLHVCITQLFLIWTICMATIESKYKKIDAKPFSRYLWRSCKTHSSVSAGYSYINIYDRIPVYLPIEQELKTGGTKFVRCALRAPMKLIWAPTNLALWDIPPFLALTPLIYASTCMNSSILVSISDWQQF